MAGKSLFALFDLPWVPIYIVLLYLFHPLYGQFAIGAAILLTALAFVNEWVTKKPLRDANSTAIMARDIAATQTRNAEVVQAMGMMDRLRNRWQGTYDQYLGHQGIANERSSLWTSFSKAYEQGEAALLTTLDAIKESGATVILISHRPGILVKMDKVLVLKDGSVARFGTRDEVLPLLLPNYHPPGAPRPPALSSPQGSPGALA